MTISKVKIKGGWLAVGLVAILFVGLVVLGYLLSARVSALQTTEKSILALSAKENNFDSLQKLFLSLKKERQAVDGHFVTKDILSNFIEQLEKMASSTSVAFEITNATMAAGASEAVRLNFTTEGSFPHSFQFISLIDSLPYALDLTQASFVWDEEGKVWKGVFNLDLVAVPVSKKL